MALSTERIAVAHVVPQSAWGGAEIYALELARHQLDRGLNVHVWAQAGSAAEAEAVKGQIPVWTGLDFRWPGVFQIGRIVRQAREARLTHLHLHGAKAVGKLFGLQHVVDLEILLHLHIWPGLKKRDPLHRMTYRGLKKVIVAGRRAELAALETLPIGKEQLSILPYGLRQERFLGVRPQRDDLGFTKDDFVYGVFSRLDRQKGVIEFLKAYEEVVIIEPRARAVVMGSRTLDDPDAESYESEIREMVRRSRVIQEGVLFLPFNRDYLARLAGVDVMVLPSYRETYSLTILDAFMLGKPVIGTDSGGTPDLIGQDRGWLVPPQDTDFLARSMIAVARNVDEIKLRGANAHQYVVREHDMEAILNRIEGIYRS